MSPKITFDGLDEADIEEIRQLFDENYYDDEVVP